MIVAFLDLLGFSELLSASPEIALDNVNSFNNVIKTKVVDNKSHPVSEYKNQNPKDERCIDLFEKSAVTSFEYMISFSDSLILGSNDADLFVKQLSNLVSTLFINYCQPFERRFTDITQVCSDRAASVEGFIIRFHGAAPILFRGGLSSGDEVDFFPEICIQKGKFCELGYSIFGRTYLNAVQLEKAGKGPRLFCDESVANSIQNKYLLRTVDKERKLYEIVWTIAACEATGCSISDPWRNVLDRINRKLLPPAINLFRFYRSEAKYAKVLPHYECLLELVCRGIVKYAMDNCGRGEDAVKAINKRLEAEELDTITLADMLCGFDLNEIHSPC